MRLLDIVLPPACAGCGRFGSLLCARCLADFRPPGDPSARFVVADAGVVIGEDLIAAVTAFAYHGAIRRVLQRVKYGGTARVAKALARASLPALRRLLDVSGPATLVPVPLHPTRLRERGFNQAALLSQALAGGAAVTTRNLLVRHRATTKQHGLDRTARIRNLAAAFRVADEATPPPSVVIVDDILTTSATMESCAIVLRAAGCQRVYGFALAREV